MGASIHRVRAQVTVSVEFDFHPPFDVTLDYVPEDGDPLARALLDKAKELARAAALAEVAAGRSLDTGGIS